MLKIYLARHGQDEDNARGILNGRRNEPLTALGEQQARETGEKIKKSRIIFDKIYCSPLIRTRRTAEIISQIIGGEKPEILEELVERDFGVMTGQTHKMIKVMCAPDIWEIPGGITYFLKPAGGETFPQLKKRGDKIIKLVQQRVKNGKVLLVSHGDIGKMIYAAYYKLPWKEVLALFHMGNSEVILLAPDSPPYEAHVIRAQQHNL